MVMTKEQFREAYNKASVIFTGREAAPDVIAEAHSKLERFSKVFRAPDMVPVFRGAKTDGSLEWAFQPNLSRKLEPTRGYYDPKNNGTHLAL